MKFHRPAFTRFGDDLFHSCGRVDQVETFAFHDLQGHGGFAVKAGGALAVFKGQIDFGQIAKGDNAVAVGFDGQGIDIARLIKGGRDFDAESALRSFDFTGCDQLVVVLHNADQFGGSDVVGFQTQWVDQNLKHLVTVARDPCFENGIERFDVVLQLLCDLRHRPFRHRASQVDDDDWKFGKVDFVDRVLVCAGREFAFGCVHSVAYVSQNFGFVPSEFEFEGKPRIAFGCCCGHLFEPVEISQFGFHDFDKQSLRVFGGNAWEGDGYKARRNFNVRLTLFGQRPVSRAADDDRQRDKGKNHAGPFRGPIDKTGHCETSANLGATGTPLVTYS